jgi:mannose-6-phosphate isomerase-like protein (cupin superfamily)
MTTPRQLSKYPVHLGLGATAHILPEMTGGMEWYEHYGELHPHDGIEGRLVSMYTFTEDWAGWEVHPQGAEIVLCTAGSMTLHQEYPDGRKQSVTLSPGEYAINPPGVWHIADVPESATAVFITAGEGTEHRPR